MHSDYTKLAEYQKLLAELRANARVISISGLVAGSARALAVAALQRETGKTFAVVSQSTRDLEPWERDLRFWYSALSGKEDCRQRDSRSAGFGDRSLRRRVAARANTRTTRARALAIAATTRRVSCC